MKNTKQSKQDKTNTQAPLESKELIQLGKEYLKEKEEETNAIIEIAGEVSKDVWEKEHARQLNESERLSELKELPEYEPTEPERT